MDRISNTSVYLEAVYRPVAPVALEGEVVLGVGGVHELDCNPTLHATKGKS